MQTLAISCFVFAAVTILGGPAASDAPSLGLPIDCVLGVDCDIQQYVDDDPGPDAVDFAGGPLTYDGHTGTDFRVNDLEAMRQGVPILAPADGRVIAIRDGEVDRIVADPSEVAGTECGNGVVLDHGDGWVTQLCHLARGSITVAQGDTVATGDVLGRMGLSGLTQFPHVHLAVRKDDVVVDPFRAGLWQDDVPYAPGGVLTAGITDRIPEFETVKQGAADPGFLPVNLPAIVVWGYVFGGRAGDRMDLTIQGPKGRMIFEGNADLDRTQAQLFRAAGRRLRAPLPPGIYTGRVALLRNGTEIDRVETTVELR